MTPCHGRRVGSLVPVSPRAQALSPTRAQRNARGQACAQTEPGGGWQIRSGGGSRRVAPTRRGARGAACAKSRDYGPGRINRAVAQTRYGDSLRQSPSIHRRPRWRQRRCGKAGCGLPGAVDAKIRACSSPVSYARAVSPAESAAYELYEYHQCVAMSPAKLAGGLGVEYKTVLRAIRRGDLHAIAVGRGKDGAPCKPYVIFRCHAAQWFARCCASSDTRSVAASVPAPDTQTQPAEGPAPAPRASPARTHARRSGRRPDRVELVTRRGR